MWETFCQVFSILALTVLAWEGFNDSGLSKIFSYNIALLCINGRASPGMLNIHLFLKLSSLQLEVLIYDKMLGKDFFITKNM